MINFDAEIIFKNKKMNFSFNTTSNRVVLFGKSGTGKSTILKIMAGFFTPNKGNIRILDKTIFSSSNNISLPSNLRNIGYLPQEYTLFPHLSVRENILYGLKVKKITLPEDEINRIIDIMGISDCLDKMPSMLSGGQLQRAALARVLLIKPDLLLLDEPFSALDMSIRQSLRDLVMDMVSEFEIPILFVTHDLEDAYVFAEELIIIDEGKILEFGDKDIVYNFPQFVETAELLDFKNIWIKEDIFKAFDMQNLKNLNKGQYICIRPENIMILREDIPKKKTLKGLQTNVKILKIHKRGKYVHLITKSDLDIEFTIHLPEHSFNKLNLFLNKYISILLKEESLICCNEKVL